MQFFVLFTQSIRKGGAGTTADYPSTNSSTSILTSPTNVENSITSQTLLSPKKKSCTPKHSITFAELPSVFKGKSINHISSISAKEKQSLFDHDKCLSKLQIGSSEKIYQNPTQITQSRFKLPPTPLTAPESMRQFGTSASFSKQQNARSVGGNIQVEVGLKSMFNQC